jgi:hypothetical protein
VSEEPDALATAAEPVDLLADLRRLRLRRPGREARLDVSAESLA